MMKKVTLLMLLCCAFTLPALAQFSYVPVTGYNADIVAEGAAGTASLSTNAAADVAVPPYVFVTQTFNPGSGICASGATALPPTNTITSANANNNTGITYTLQPYTGNNVLQMLYNASGTFTVTTPMSASKLYVVCLGGSGAVTFTAVVNFTDATSQTITNSPQAPDWCGGAAQYKLTTQQYFRIPINATACSSGGACQYLYEIPITIDPANFSKSIASVTFTNNSSGTVFSIFAMGAQAPCTTPTAQPTALTLTPGVSQASGSFTAATGTPSGYLVVRYPFGATVTAPVNATTYTAGQALGLGTVVSVGSGTTFTSTGLTLNTQYTYYIYSYNTAANCGGPIYYLPSPLTGNVTTNSCGTLSGTIPVGPGLPNTPAGGFTSLTNAVAYITNNGLGGNTVLALQAGYVGTSPNETFPITFPANPCIGATKTLTIRPATGVSGLVISNSSNDAPVIDFNGATYVTIDGVNNGLTISNTSTASTANTSTIRFINDAFKCSVTNCTVSGSSTGSLSTNCGTIYFATGTTNGNDSITIANCKIGPAGTNLPSKGIYAQGSTANATIANSGVLVNNNEIYDFFLTGGCSGLHALSGNTDWTITNNKIYETATRTFTSGGTWTGIHFVNTGFGPTVQINSNTIGYANATGTGTLTLDGTVAGVFIGINFNGLSSSTAPNNINSNTIANIAFTSSSGSCMGIINASSAGSNTVNINNNIINNIATTTTTGDVRGIFWTSATNMTINNNTISNISRTGNGTTYGIYSGSSSVNETVIGNSVFNLTATSAGASTLNGIYQNTAAGTKIFQNNQVYGFSGTNGTSMNGIRIGYGTTIDISGNTVYNLNSTGGTSGSVVGIATGTVGTTFNVYKNKIYNLSMSSSGGVVSGITNSTSTSNIYNNLIGDLSSTTYTSTTSPYMGVAGINISSGTTNIYNNTIRIGTVTSSGTNFSAMGIFANTTPTVLLQNNLVVNMATPVGLGKAVAFQRSSTSLTSYAAASGSNSFYAGTPGANNLIFWDGTNAYQDLASYKTAVAPRDAFSFNDNPSFISTNGSNATYLHLTAGVATVLESAGITAALFNTDFDGQTRPGPTGSVNGGGINYDIGADEFDGIPLFTCVQPAPGNTLSTGTSICSGTSITLSLQNNTPGNGVTYKWYSSTDGTNYTQISGATSSTYVTTPTVSTYYYAIVSCGTTLSATSTPVFVTFANNVTSTTPAQRCGTGSVNLLATASSGTLKWYADAIGGISVGTGSPFTTPSITNTTTYYVGAEGVGPGEAALGTSTSLTSATGYPTAFMNRHEQYWHQMVFTAAELNAAGLNAGNITALKFNITSIGDAPNVTNFTVMLGPTSNTTLSAFTTTGLTQVYGPATYTQTVGVNTITFSTPYPWDGTSNIIVDLRQGGVDNLNNAITYFTNTAGNTTVYAFTSNTTPILYTSNPSPTATTNRLNTVFVGQATCSSPRVPVTATVNTAPAFTITGNQTVCNGAITPLTVTSTVASYNNYTWTPVTNLYTNAAATIPYTAGTNASTVYFKSTTAGDAVYTANANNTTTQCAGVATTTQTVLPGVVTAVASPSSLCYSGTATLSMTPATGYGAGTFQWQSSANNTLFADINGATSATYTTPVTTTNTYYRVIVKNGAGTVCLNSASDTARVFAPAVTGTTPASRCGTGTLTLGATGVDGTLNWYSGLTGGTSVGTGTSFTTPSISGTTTYYVAAETAVQGLATLGAGALTTVSTTSSADEISPFDHYYGGFKSQNLITAAELNAAGLVAGPIYSVSFDVVAGGGLFQGFNMDIGSTAAATLTTTPVGGLTPVYTTTAPAGLTTPASGLVTVNFSSPYTWDGTSNLVIQTCWSNNNTGGTGTTVKYDNTPFVSHSYYEADSQTPATICGASTMSSTLMSSRPKIVINGTTLCANTPRTAVVATVNPLPTPTITPAGPVNICTGQTTTLTGGGGGTYQWRNAAGNITGATNSTYTTGTAGTYRVIVTTTATGCKDTSAPVTVNVNTLPVVNLGNDTTFCSGNTLTLNAGNPGATYLWNNATTNQTRNVTATGTYWVRVTNGNGCQKADTINVTVNPTPVVNLGNDTNVCQGQSLVLNSGNPGATRLWDNNSTAQTRTVTASGTYYVRVTNSFNCTARDTIVATFLPSPTVNLGPDQDICSGNTVTLDAGNPGETYLWDNGTTLQTRVVGATGTYFVTVKNVANCKGSDTVTVTVHPSPIVNLGNDTTFCYGKTLTLDAGNPGASYLWNTNSTNQTIDVNTTGTYSVVVTDVWTCVGTDAIDIVVKDPPSAVINAVHGNPATYTFNLLNMHYVTGATWNFGDGTPTVTGYTVQHTYANNGIYTVTVTLAGECEDNVPTSRTVDVFDANGTGIDQVDNAKELVLYPNPARDVVVIENKKDYKMKQVTLYSVVGQMLSTSAADSPDKHKVNVTGLTSGIYTLRIETDKGIVIRKFEIMK